MKQHSSTEASSLIHVFEPFSAIAKHTPVPDDPSKIAVGKLLMSKDRSDAQSVGSKIYAGRFGTREREEFCLEYAKSIPKAAFRAIYSEKGADRRPVNHYDLTIFSSIPKLITFDSKADVPEHQQCHEVPSLPGTFLERYREDFLVTGVLTEDECAQLIGSAEGSPNGYIPDEPVTNTPPPVGYAPRAASFVWMNSELANILFERTRRFMPGVLGAEGQHQLVGLNARLRFYRYSPLAIYRPHVDGAWPGSTLETIKRNEGGMLLQSC